jgi:uncharacterized repeat protein (TIGR01451 family)
LVKHKKIKNTTWAMISVLAVIVIVCLAAYFYFFYFNNPGLNGMKAWVTSAGSSDTSESAPQSDSSGQNEVKPDLSIDEVRVERVDPNTNGSGNAFTKKINGVEGTLAAIETGVSETTNNTEAISPSESTVTANETTGASESTVTTNEVTASASESPITANETTGGKKSGEIYIGDTVKFDILIKNNGTQPAKNITIIDLPPDKLENINMAEDSAGSYDPFSRKIVLDNTEIGAGKTINIAFTGFISNDLNDGEIIKNKVSASYKDAGIAEKLTELPVTGLPDYSETLIKVEDVNGAKVWARDILKYTVIVKNSGKKAGGSIILNCPVPIGTGYVDGTASGSGLTLSPNKSLLQFNIGTIEPGTQKEVSFKVFVAEYLTFSTEIKSGFFIADGLEKISLDNPSAAIEASVFQTVVCMGDSQVVLSDYTVQLGTLLNNQYSHAVFNVIPTGVKGEMANFAIQRFDRDVRIHNPDIIVIGYGCNDAGEATGLYRYHMDILLRQAVSTGAKVVVYGVGFIDLSISKWLGKANYTIFNDILKNDICPKYGAVYVDLYSPMSGDYKKYIREDGMHWTEEGATLAANEVFKAITSVLDGEGKVQTGKEK